MAPDDADLVAEVRRRLSSSGVLVVDDLRPADLEQISWSGSPTHVANVAMQLDRVASGHVEYLTVRAPGGAPIAIGGIDYVVWPGAGAIWQLATRPELQGLGIGTRLVGAAEERIRARGLTTARLSVEHRNPRARALYERLGYVPVDDRADSWPAERDDGSMFTYETTVTDMEKHL